MNEFQISPDDPRLTAYALGELEGDDRTAIETALRFNPALHSVIDGIRATASQLEAALAAEPPLDANGAEFRAAPPLQRRVVILPGKMARASAAPSSYRRLAKNSARQLLEFPQVYYVIGGLAAACFALLVALRPPMPHPPAAEQKHYVQMPVAPLEKPAEEVAAPISVPQLDAVAAANEPAAEGAGKIALGSAAGQFSPLGVFAPPAGGLLQQSKFAADALAPASGPTFSFGGAGPASIPATESLERQLAAMRAQTMRPRVAAGTSARVQPAEAKFAVETIPSAPGNRDRDGVVTNALARAPGGSGNAFDGRMAASGSSLLLQRRSPSAFDGGVWRFSPAPQVPYGSLDLFPGSRSRPSGEASVSSEAYGYRAENPFLPAAQNPLSTFALDVDTASYTNVRRMLASGHRLPPADAVRIEELVNYFPYRYAAPADGAPFAATLEVAEAPWAPTHRLVRIGLKARDVAATARPAANLVFLLDVSGSMAEANKLPLVKESLRLLVGKLRADDRIAIVTYAGTSGLALPSTPVSQSRDILDAIDALAAGGSTNGAMGIQLAYDIAKANFATDGVNRVVLCTDGDFNVGPATQGELVRLIEEKTKTGVFLTVLGFGVGNLKDSTLELLADKGNGHYGYIDTRAEAERLLVEQLNATLVTVAKDAKVQVDFNPAKVASYRLIGYENRLLNKEDFANDRIDAGEIGAGHTVTALYEIVPVGAADAAAIPPAEPSKYLPRAVAAPLPAALANELLTVKLRYKEPAGNVSRQLEFPLIDPGKKFAEASADFKFAAAVASFGMVLRDSLYKGSATLGEVMAWAAAGATNAADDTGGYRREFIGLVREAQTLLR